MCMERKVIQKLGEKIGKVEDIKTDAGECMGQFARVRISINIMQLLKKVVFIQQGGTKIPMPVLYEKIQDFFLLCACRPPVQGMFEVQRAAKRSIGVWRVDESTYTDKNDKTKPNERERKTESTSTERKHHGSQSRQNGQQDG